jgi:hypothetical protein
MTARGPSKAAPVSADGGGGYGGGEALERDGPDVAHTCVVLGCGDDLNADHINGSAPEETGT